MLRSRDSETGRALSISDLIITLLERRPAVVSDGSAGAAVMGTRPRYLLTSANGPMRHILGANAGIEVGR